MMWACKSCQIILQKYSVGDNIFRDFANPQDSISCSNLKLKLGYDIKNEYFGKEKLINQ